MPDRHYMKEVLRWLMEHGIALGWWFADSGVSRLPGVVEDSGRTLASDVGRSGPHFVVRVRVLRARHNAREPPPSGAPVGAHKLGKGKGRKGGAAPGRRDCRQL